MPAPTTTPNTVTTAALTAVAACSMAVSGAREIQLLPAGTFCGIDGRPAVVDGKPTGIAAWRLDTELATALVAAVERRANPLVIDYEHQTLLARTNGQPAPAAGWFHKVEWREGVGLFAVDVTWTEQALTMIEADQYRFISPVINYDKKTGAVTGLQMAAITNYAAIDGMDAVALAAALTTTSTTQEPQMEELLEQLRWLLNLPVGSTAEDVLAQLNKLADMIKQGQDATAAATCDLVKLITDQRATVAALGAALPDPAKYVPVSVMHGLQQQLAALTAQANGGDLERVLDEAKTAGKLLPVQEEWARNLGKTDMAALSAYLDSVQPVAALAGMQTKSTPPRELKPGGSLTADQLALCTAFGLSEDEYTATLRSQSLA